MYGGFVEWEKGEMDDGSDSTAKQVIVDYSSFSLKAAYSWRRSSELWRETNDQYLDVTKILGVIETETALLELAVVWKLQWQEL